MTGPVTGSTRPVKGFVAGVCAAGVALCPAWAFGEAGVEGATETCPGVVPGPDASYVTVLGFWLIAEK